MLSESFRRLPALGAARAERIVRDLLERAGIAVGGTRPFDIQVHDPAFYLRAVRDGRLGVAESYIDGQWDCEALDECTAMMLRANLQDQVRDWRMPLYVAATRLMNRQAPWRAFQAGERHYDLGNDFYSAILDRRMLYTCAYWKDAATLDEAQEAKLDLVCRKIGLRPGMRVLELGCGWGGFARHAAERHGAEVTGYTVSREQAALGREMCAGLPVEIHLADYRQARGRYDAVVSIGMMEHVGLKNHRTYMEVVDRCLSPGGVAFIHTIGGNASDTTIDTFFEKYLFPNALLPSLAQLARAMEGLFVVEDVHNIGPDYDRTLMCWYRNLEDAWPGLRARHGDRFFRLWRYYLLACAGAFRARFNQLFQIVMTRPGTPQPPCRAV